MATSNPTPQPSTPNNGFPWKAAGALFVAVGILTGLHWYGDHSKGWDPQTFATAWQFHWPQPPRPAVPIESKVTTHVAPGQPAIISKVMVDDHYALDPFYAALWQLEEKKTAGDIVTVIHYGDSPTTADLITGDVRAQLQQRFGDAGYGFNLAAKPWAWYGHRHVEMSDSGWLSSQKDATGVGRYKQGSYGLGGAIFAGSAGAHTTYTLTGAPQDAVVVHYLGMPGGGSVNVSAGDTVLQTINTSADDARVMTVRVPLPAGTRKVSLSVTAGSVKVFGVDFRTGGSGVLYDSLGLNGATTTILSRTFEPKLLAQSLQTARPQLIVINYGTNESQFGGLVSTLDKELHLAIANVRAAAPGVPILIMSPMDRGDHRGGAIVTKAEIPQIVAIQRRVAAETGCAYFDTYDAMGGSGTVANWYAAQPRLMTADLIHPTPQGAVLVANLLVENLYAGYDRWKRMHGVTAQKTELKGPPVVIPSTTTPPHAKPSAAVPLETPAETPKPAPEPVQEAPIDTAPGNTAPAKPDTPSTPSQPATTPATPAPAQKPEPATQPPASPPPSSNPQQ